MKTKVCTKCKLRRSIDLFHNVSRNSDGLADWCRKCFNAANIAWREKNWDRKMEQQKERRHELRQYVDAIKAQAKCTVCPEKEICCLEYHHTDPSKKDINPGDMVGSGWSKARIDKELAKCIVLCSNCHRKVHKGILNIGVVA